MYESVKTLEDLGHSGEPIHLYCSTDGDELCALLAPEGFSRKIVGNAQIDFSAEELSIPTITRNKNGLELTIRDLSDKEALAWERTMKFQAMSVSSIVGLTDISKLKPVLKILGAERQNIALVNSRNKAYVILSKYYV